MSGYDSNQLSCVLKPCAVCQVSRYMRESRTICMSCSEAGWF